MADFLKTWYAGSSGHKFYSCGLSSPNAHFTSLIYNLFSLGYNKKGKHPEFCLSYSDKTRYVSSSVLKYYPGALSSQICIFDTLFIYLF